MNALKKVTKRQWFLIAYLPIHLIWYMILEQVNVTNYAVVYSPLDDLIPFCEWFIFPYLCWFLYMVIPGFYFLAKDPKAFERYLLAMFIGFFLSLTIISIYPTGQNLRPDVIGDGNIALRIVNFIYNFDTNTNVFPSMHVVGAVAVAFSVALSDTLKKKVWLQICNWVLCIAIIAATVFLKQHSVLDIFGALIVEIPIIILAYKGYFSKLLDKLFKPAEAAVK